MRLNLIKTAPLLILLIVVLPVSAEAKNQSVSSTELIEAASELDGHTVFYSGEAVGDTLYSGNFAWINVSDGTNAIGVHIPAAEARKIEYLGRYRVVGDVVSLSGTFHRACAQHGGDMDIHAESIHITQRGHTEEDGPSPGLLLAAGALSLCALAASAFVLKRKL